MKDHDHLFVLWKNLNLCLMKYFLVCVLLSFLFKGASFASGLECEIRASCSLSRDCHSSYQMTVAPDSNVNVICSIGNGETTAGMTWQQVKEKVTANAGLFLQQIRNSTCRCTRIRFPRAVQLMYSSTSPRFIYENKTRNLVCLFKGWPRPRVAWYKNGRPINGSEFEGFYHTWRTGGLPEIYQDTFHYTLHIPPGREEYEGFYSCVAENNIPGWSSKQSSIQVIYACPRDDGPVPESSKIQATAFTNATLKCLVDSQLDYEYDCYLEWHFNNKSQPLKSSEKYTIDLQKTNRKCKEAFTLTINNVTDDDEVTYSCHMYCEWDKWENTSAAIHLEVSPQPVGNPGGNKLFINYSSSDVTWVTGNLTSVLKEHKIRYQLGGPIDQSMADKVYDSSLQVLLVVLPDNYKVGNVCPEEGKMSIKKMLGRGDSPLIVFIGKITTGSLACLGKENLLEFEGRKNKDLEKKLLQAILGEKVVSR